MCLLNSGWPRNFVARHDDGIIRRLTVSRNNGGIFMLNKLLFFRNWHPLGRKLAILILVKISILWVFFRIAPIQKQTITPTALSQKLVHHD
ncbi:MAG: hypothetical protein K2W94_07150 [Alphaproteobacteria bacterium]|nr:hypothetical protein [Alphaproteobacteria bacterium]